MKTETVFEDKRLLEALDYIDRDLIAEAMDALKIPDAVKEYVPRKRTPFKIWKQFAAFAACLILLAFASPVFNKVAEVISSFAAGWGSGTTEETSNNSDTEEVPYLQFSPDLEPISQELVDEINDAFAVYYFGRSNDEWLRKLIEYYGEDNMEKINKTYRAHYKVIRNYDCYSPYFGTINDYVVFSFIGSGVYGGINERVIIEEYEFYKETWLYKDGALHYISDAYEQGLINESHLKQLSIRYQDFLEYKKVNELIMPGP